MYLRLLFLVPIFTSSLAANSEVFEKCEHSNRSVFGAYRNSNIDLAIDFVETKYPHMKPVRIGVIDTGFDVKYQGHFKNEVKTDRAQSWLQRNSLTFSTGLHTPKLQSSGEDKIGHGTAVISIIGSKQIGINPNAILHSFKFVIPDSTIFEMSRQDKAANQQRYRTEAFFYAIKNACDAGNKIINMSMGDMNTEAAISTFENTPVGLFNKRPLYQYLYDRGCVLYMSSGNAGVKKGLERAPKPSIVRVGSTSRMAEESDFSSNSHIKATGEKVLALIGDSLMRDRSHKCRGETEFLVSGTSFSSPIVAGGQSLVLGILETSPVYQSLGAHKQVDLLNDIMYAGAKNGVYDAFRSVVLADQWKSASRIAHDRFTLRIYPPGPGYCQTNGSCDIGDLKCINNLRIKNAICDDSDITEIIRVADQNNEFEWFLSLFFFGTKSGSQVSTQLREVYKNKILESYQKYDFSPLEALDYSRFIKGIYPEYETVINDRLVKSDLQGVLMGKSVGAEAGEFINTLSSMGLIDGEVFDQLIARLDPKTDAFGALIDSLVISKIPIDDFQNRLNRILSKREAILLQEIDELKVDDAKKIEVRRKMKAAVHAIRLKSIFGARYQIPGRDQMIVEFVDKISTDEDIQISFSILSNDSISRSLKIKTLVQMARMAATKKLYISAVSATIRIKELHPPSNERYEIYKNLVQLDNLYGLDYFSLYTALAQDPVLDSLAPQLASARKRPTLPDVAKYHFDHHIVPAIFR